MIRSVQVFPHSRGHLRQLSLKQALEGAELTEAGGTRTPSRLAPRVQQPSCFVAFHTFQGEGNRLLSPGSSKLEVRPEVASGRGAGKDRATCHTTEQPVTGEPPGGSPWSSQQAPHFSFQATQTNSVREKMSH